MKHLTVLASLLLALCLIAGSALAADFRPWNEEDGFQYVTFGSYPQTAEGGVEPMRWLVLDTFDDGTAFLLTELVIDCHPVVVETNQRKIAEKKYRHIKKLEDSDLYTWMNSEMIDTLFTAEEQSVLDPARGVKLFLPTNEEYIGRYGWPRAIDDQHSGGRMCDSTPYATAQGVYRGPYNGSMGATFWCARLRGWRYVQIVGFDGHESWAGVTRSNVGVRPAVLVRRDQVSFAGGEGTSDMPYVLTVGGSYTVTDDDE